jgi:hypothetical protein
MLVLPVVAFIVHSIDKKDKVKVNTGTKMYVKSSNRNLSYRLFHFTNRFFLTRNYIDKIYRKYELIYPGEQKMIAKRSIHTALISWILCTFVIVSLFFFHPSLLNASLVIILTFVINNEVISRLMNYAELRMLEQMVLFISNVRHNYHKNHMVDDAILDSIDGLSYEMKVHGQKIFDIITSNQIKEEVNKYNASTENKYLKIFLSLCIGVIEFSDKKVNGQLLFITNLENLKTEINIEILKRKKLKYLFSGTTFVTMAACIPISQIQDFGISVVPRLESFYLGRWGILSVIMIYAFAVIVYMLNQELQASNRIVIKNYNYLEKIHKNRMISRALDNYMEKKYGKMLQLKETMKRLGENISPKQLLIQRILVAIATFLLCLVIAILLHLRNQHNLIYQIDLSQNISELYHQNQQQQMEDIIKIYLVKYKRNLVTKEQIERELAHEGNVRSTKTNQILADDIIWRLQNYQQEYFHWYELVISLGIAVIAYYTPYYMILYKKKILSMSMEDEVIQYEAIIYMLMYTDYITVKDILEEMELFAVVFKKSIQECINDYNSGDVEALMELKEKEPYESFRRLIDNLIRCDMIPIHQAFDEIESDRTNYHDRRRQENEISIQKKVDIAKPISFIPAILVCAYLIIPLILASMQELKGFTTGLQGLS